MRRVGGGARRATYWELRGAQKRMLAEQLGRGHGGAAGDGGEGRAGEGAGALRASRGAQAERALATVRAETEGERGRRQAQVEAQREADARGRAIQSDLYRQFRDDPAPGPRGHPLLRRTRLTGSNPLLPDRPTARGPGARP